MNKDYSGLEQPTTIFSHTSMLCPLHKGTLLFGTTIKCFSLGEAHFLSMYKTLSNALYRCLKSPWECGLVILEKGPHVDT